MLNSTTSFLGKNFNHTGTATFVYGLSVYVGDRLEHLLSGTFVGIGCFILMYASAVRLEKQVMDLSKELKDISEIDFPRYFDSPEKAREVLSKGLQRILPIANSSYIASTECPYEDQLTEIFNEYSGTNAEKRFLYALTLGLIYNGGTSDAYGTTQSPPRDREINNEGDLDSGLGFVPA